MDLLRDLTTEFDTAILLITHDLGVVSDMAQKVIVMYAGEVVEEAPTKELFNEPFHPYTDGLIDSVPTITGEITRLHTIEGQVPLPDELPHGCRFAPRCKKVFDKCLIEKPELKPISDTRSVRCFLYDHLEEEDYN